MKITKQSVTIVSPIDDYDMLRRIELAGRTCYQSEPRGPTFDFIRMLIKRGHLSVLEHEGFSARFICDRGVSHEIVRHRIASYSQESTRYCKYDGGITVIEPPGLSSVEHVLWYEAMMDAEHAYLELLETTTPQIARAVLPTCLKTELVMTANLREWRHFFSLRCHKTAHPQMRGLVLDLLGQVKHVVPVVFEDLDFA